MADMLGETGRLVIRTPLAGDAVRSRTTQVVDRLAHLVGWMETIPRAYPTRAGLEARLGAHGLQVAFRPLYGRTPFNNWLLVASRAPGPLA